jgi:hypothetical protein
MTDLRRLAVAALAPLAAASVGCGDAPQFEARFPPSFPERTRSVSVVGVYRDGRLDAEAWDRLGLGAALPAPCPPAFGEPLRAADPEGFAALDEEARANGMSEELLARLGAKAKGEAMLLVTVHGRASGPTRVGSGPRGQRRNAPPPSRGSHRGMAVPSGTPQDFASPRGDLEASAVFFSVPRHERLGGLTMKYSGADADAALAEFVKRLTEATEGATCGGWTLGKEAPVAPPPAPAR